ncbi:unnamed protein product [Tenebrio molitor]|nr:unnamed protein product [Tenebrio molitor]
MQKVLIVASLCLVVALALPYDLVEDEQGQHYYLVPVSRVRRETKWDIENPGKLKIQHSGTIFNNGDHKLKGEAYGSKSLVDRRDPAVFGGKLDYNHNSGSSLSVSAQHKEHRGTRVGVEGKYNLYRNGPFHADVSGKYDRTYGGASSNPSFSTHLTGTVDF